MHLKIFGKWRPFCLALNVLTNLSNMLHASSILPFILSIYFLLNVSLQTASEIEYLWVEIYLLYPMVSCRYKDKLGVPSETHWTQWRHQTKTFSALLALCEGNYRSPVNPPHKGHWRGAFMRSLTCAWTHLLERKCWNFDKSSLVQVMAWHRKGDKPWPGPMSTKFTRIVFSE